MLEVVEGDDAAALVRRREGGHGEIDCGFDKGCLDAIPTPTECSTRGLEANDAAYHDVELTQSLESEDEDTIVITAKTRAPPRERVDPPERNGLISRAKDTWPFEMNTPSPSAQRLAQLIQEQCRCRTEFDNAAQQYLYHVEALQTTLTEFTRERTQQSPSTGALQVLLKEDLESQFSIDAQGVSERLSVLKVAKERLRAAENEARFERARVDAFGSLLEAKTLTTDD